MGPFTNCLGCFDTIPQTRPEHCMLNAGYNGIVPRWCRFSDNKGVVDQAQDMAPPERLVKANV